MKEATAIYKEQVRLPFPRRLRPTFFLEFTVVFAIVALLLSLLTGVILSRYIGSSIQGKVVNDTVVDMQEHVSRHVKAAVAAEKLSAPLSREDYQRLDEAMGFVVLPPYMRVNIYNSQGSIVYSDDPELVGRSFAHDDVQKALAGETVARIQEPPGPESGDLPEHDCLLEVYTPLRLEGSSAIVGALEVYRDYGPIAAFISDIQRSVYIGVGAALAFLYFALLFLVKRGSDLIRKQQRELETRAAELKGSYDSIVAVLCAALDLRDNVTSGHARRVSELAAIVAWQLGLRKEQLRQIEQAAILHDIGKIGVADSVLSKPGALTDAEWEEMRRHPELGYHMLKDIEFLKEAAEIVYAHHERFDGGGYPRGLQGDEIPLGARIFAVIDAYDAMTSHRPYRKPVSHHQAVEEIARNSGSQFDPQVVRAFLEAERRGLIQGTQDEVEAFFASVTRKDQPHAHFG